ncbi:MAG TPA: replicative DNA helicase [bacterium]|nr:replicative DNA helicase [bacterium]HOL66826.1 replicative DNA helicase [bacterium]HPP11516.1 replicative DNA helicase [bacterium]
MPPKSLAGERIPPQNIEAEQALLGCMLIEEEAKIKAFENIRADYFYSQIHKEIFKAMLALFDRNEPCDLVTLTEQLKKTSQLENIGGLEYLTTLVEGVPTAAHVDDYIRIVKDKYILRSLIANATRVIAEASEEPEEVESLLDKAEALIFEISQQRIEKEAYPIKDLVHQAVEAIEQLHSGQGLVTGIPTGFRDLDNATTGLQPSDLIIIASRPSMGKTSLACNIALNVSDAGLASLIFSLEMSKEQLVQRLLCVEARVNLHDLRKGRLSDQERVNLLMAASRLEKARIFIDDAPALNVFELRARARRLKAKENIQLVIVDYLQLMRGRGRAENKQQEVSEISASLKALAKELKIPVIAISQLSRETEKREGKRPELSDLRESGAIEQDADLVLLLYRDEVYHPDDVESRNKAEVNIAKQRNGPIKTITLTFLKEFTRFENYSPRVNGGG